MAVPLERREEPDEVGYGIRNDGVDWKMMLRLGTNWWESQMIYLFRTGSYPGPTAMHRLNRPYAFHPPLHLRSHRLISTI